MKKSEITQLTQLIEILVTKEVRKQLPSIIAETFQNMMGKPVVTEQVQQPIEKPTQPKEDDAELNLKTSLREMFAGTPRVDSTPQNLPTKPRQYTKNPIFNQILNETVPLHQHERNMGSRPAFLNQYRPAPNALEEGAQIQSLPVGSPPVLQEGQESNHIPMETLPEGVSVLDVAKAGILPQGNPVTEALTNFDRMKKILDQSKGKRY